jgi:hypothetical protein
MGRPNWTLVQVGGAAAVIAAGHPSWVGVNCIAAGTLPSID